MIGAGIVGLSCAWQLARRGIRCVLLDPALPGVQASWGNAGSISVGNVMPQATPGIAWKGLRMLFDRQSPLKLDLRHAPAYWRWLAAFVAAGGSRRVGAIMDALHAINHASRAHWLELADDAGAAHLVQPSGYLHVYSEPATFAAAASERTAMRERTVRFEELDRAGLQDLEPGLGPRFLHGTFQHDALALADPGGFCAHLLARLQARGVRTMEATARALLPDAGGCRIDTDQGMLRVERVVVAAGAWSAPLLRPLGVRLPIVAARGYHLMYPPQPGLVRRPTLWAERYMVVSPMAGGIRMTSIKELTATGSAPRFGFIHRRDADARTLFPALAAAARSQWAGLRPCTPDSLPVIDTIDERIHVACGHGHLGITQGPTTGVLVAQSIAGEPTSIPLAPYSAARFAAALH